jgi:hypothetical protein
MKLNRVLQSQPHSQSHSQSRSQIRPPKKQKQAAATSSRATADPHSEEWLFHDSWA